MRELFEWPYNGFGDWALFIFVWILILALAGGILLGAFYLIDSTFLVRKSGHCRIVGKEFKESHYTTVMIYNGATKTQTPVTTYHPDAWTLTVQRRNETDDIEVSESNYLYFKIDTVYPCQYSEGRITGNFYIKSIGG